MSEEIDKELDAQAPGPQSRIGVMISRLYYHRDDMRDPNGDPKARENMYAASKAIKDEFAQLLAVAKAAKEYRAYRTGGQIKDPTKTLAKIVDELDAALSALAPDVLEER